MNAIVKSKNFHRVQSATLFSGDIVFAVYLPLLDNVTVYSSEFLNTRSTCNSDEYSTSIKITSTSESNGLSSEATNITYRIPADGTEGVTLSADLISNLKKLKDISALEYNWNGNDAVPFSKALIDKTSSLLMELDVQPEIFPTADNSIQFEFEGDNDSYLEFQIYESSIADVFCIDKDGRERVWNIDSDAIAINGVLKYFYG